MATVLEKYWNLRCQVEQMMAQNPSHAGLLWSYGEVIYRISVLETCQSFCKSAPQTTDPNCLRGHYQMVDAFIQCMTQERRYGPDRGPNTANERNSAQNNLALVVTDYRSRFSSFNASAPDQYASAISRAISAVLAVWLQFRNTFVPIPDPKAKPVHSRALHIGLQKRHSSLHNLHNAKSKWQSTKGRNLPDRYIPNFK